MLKKSKFILPIFVMSIALSLIFLAASLTIAAYPDGVISHWKLNEVTPDLLNGTYEDSFNGNDGTGDVNPIAAIGIVNGAQGFSGELTGINVPADSSLNWLSNQSFSIEYWVKINTGIPDGNQVVMGRFDETSDLFWYTGIEGGSGFASFAMIDSDGVDAFLGGSIGTINLADGSWHHIVAVRDDSVDTNFLYVDGLLEDSMFVNFTGVFSSNTAELNIGWFDFLTFFRFQGLIDEIAIYKRALSHAEIVTHRDAGLLGEGIETLIPDPAANAGPDQIVYDEITLDGSQSSHPDGEPMSYLWQLDHRENSGFNRTATGINPTIFDLNRGFYDVTLIVEDDAGRTSTDQMLFSATGPKGDFDFDGDVDGNDLSVFRNYYGIID